MRRLVLWAVLGLIIGLLIRVVFLSDADAAYRPALVVQDEQAITCNGWGWRDNALEAARELNTQAVRINMLEWRDGCDEDAAVAAVAAAGMKPQLTLAGSPAYMRSKVLLHRNQVSTYAVWNEPEWGVFRCCDVSLTDREGVRPPTHYRRIYMGVYRMIKRTDPGAKVLLGELSPFGVGGRLWKRSRWVGGALRTGRPLVADGIAIHPYHWSWSERVDSRYFAELREFKRVVRRYARQRKLVTPRGKPVPIYSTEHGISAADGQQGDAEAVKRAWRYCVKLRFRQCAQYQVFPSFSARHTPLTWQTSLTGLDCRPTATFYALRQAVTGRTGLAQVRWPECPKPIEPLPPGWGTPAAPPLPPTPPAVLDEVPEVELPDQPVEEIPEPVVEEPVVVEPEPVVEEPVPAADEGGGP